MLGDFFYGVLCVKNFSFINHCGKIMAGVKLIIILNLLKCFNQFLELWPQL